MPSLSHPLRSLRLTLALAVICGLSFMGWRVSASETNWSWLIRLKNAPAVVWAAIFQANTETVSQSGLATEGNRARPTAQHSIALPPALRSALRSREALDDPKQPGLSDALLPAASAPLAPAMTGCATPSFGATTNFGVGRSPISATIGDLNSDGKPDLAVANYASANVSITLGTGVGSFGTATNFSVGSGPASVAISDLNGDGKPDLAVANYISNNVSVLLGTGTGSFGAPTNFAVGDGPHSVAIGDLNVDGKPDLVTANASSDNVSVLLGTGTGSFGAPTTFDVGDGPVSVTIGDLNGDGKPDLAVANGGPDNVSVLLGTGTGSFGLATNFGVGDSPISIVIGDLNGDGKPDLVTANQNTNNISVLLGTGTGSFGAATNFSVGSVPLSVAIGDLNGDGKPDLAVANEGSNSVSVLLGTGTGSFGVATNFGVGSSPRSIAIGDLNGDGKLDLAVANGNSHNVSVLLGTGTGSFGTATNFGVGFSPSSIAIGDLNGDGNPDLVMANQGSNNVSVLLGIGMSTGSFGAATNFGVGSVPSSVAIGDLNGDGKPDLAVANHYSNYVSVLLSSCTPPPNTAPILMPVAATRQPGSPASNSQIAHAADVQDAANTLLIQISSDGVTFGTTATSGGVTVTLTDRNAGATGTNPDATGKVFADIVAACAARSASFTLKVTDSGALTATATLTVTVNANAAPTVGNYTNRVIPLGGTVTVTPDAVPLDNGTIASVTATAVPNTFTGTFSGNTATGAVTVTNASPSGTYTITVTVTDNCGTAVSKQFMLTVATPVVGGSLADPLNCTGIGSVVNVTATVSNTSGVVQAATLSAALPAQLLALPGTCQASSGTCAINNPASVTWSGSLANGQTVTITYQAQIADGVPAGTQVCVTSTASFTGGGSANVTACQTLNCPSSGPGAVYPAASAISDQKPGSVLLFNLYTSDAAAPNQQNTRIALTNTDALRTAYVHLFFVDGTSCSVADAFVCLTPNQTAAFLASDIDPGTIGYVIAVATDRSGCPLNFNFLLGDAFVKLSSGHAANLPAESVAALPGGFVPCDPLAPTAVLNFDDRMYNALPRTLALSNIASRADGNNTLLIVNRLGGSLATSASTLANLFGVLYDDSETPFSFSFAPGTCQFRSLISSNFPRTTPRFEQVIPAGRSGWLKFALFTEGAISGAAINANTNAGTQANAFNQGHNLHKLTLTTTTTLTVPVFPPGC